MSCTEICSDSGGVCSEETKVCSCGDNGRRSNFMVWYHFNDCSVINAALLGMVIFFIISCFASITYSTFLLWRGSRAKAKLLLQLNTITCGFGLIVGAYYIYTDLALHAIGMVFVYACLTFLEISMIVTTESFMIPLLDFKNHDAKRFQFILRTICSLFILAKLCIVILLFFYDSLEHNDMWNILMASFTLLFGVHISFVILLILYLIVQLDRALSATSASQINSDSTTRVSFRRKIHKLSINMTVFTILVIPSIIVPPLYVLIVQYMKYGWVLFGCTFCLGPLVCIAFSAYAGISHEQANQIRQNSKTNSREIQSKEFPAHAGGGGGAKKSKDSTQSKDSKQSKIEDVITITNSPTILS